MNTLKKIILLEKIGYLNKAIRSQEVNIGGYQFGNKELVKEYNQKVGQYKKIVKQGMTEWQREVVECLF